MEIGPIVSALMRNKLGAVLVAAQIAVTMAILCNGAFIAWQRYTLMSRDTGMDVANIFTIDSIAFGANINFEDEARADLAAIQALPGVQAATTINSIPLSGGGWGEGLTTTPDPEAPRTTANLFFVDTQGLETLGVSMKDGRDFQEQEMILREPNKTAYPEVAIITQALADEMFPDGPALGQTIYSEESPMRVVGILEKMQGSWLGWSGVERVILLPGRMQDSHSTYIVRTQPGQRDALMPRVEEVLAARNDQRVLRRLTALEEFRADSYAGDRTVAVTLMVVMGLLIGVTGLGIVGLASFLVSQRTKQIGTRRALGARRFHVVRYFLVENWLITSVGLSIGLVMTIALNYYLVQAFELPRLDWIYIPMGLALIWTLGIGAALGPARRASRISPAIATRTV